MPQTHGTGTIDRTLFRRCAATAIFEPGALVFHPENVSVDEDVYVGHYAILKGYHENQLVIGAGSWIGQAAFLHAAGGITIGTRVGIAPHVCILTSTHGAVPRHVPIMDGALAFAPVVLGDGCDLGIGAIILPGITVGIGAQVGAGAVVTHDVPDYAVVAGNPARVLRSR